MTSSASPGPVATASSDATAAAAPPRAARRRLGEILVEQGAVSEEQLHAALGRQKETRLRLGEVLLEQRVVNPVALLRALAAQFGFDFVDLDEIAIDPVLAQRVPEALARRHRALPIGRDGEVIVVAMANPADVFAIDDLRSLLRAPIKPVMSDPDQIADAISRRRHSDAQVDAAIRLAVEERAVADPKVEVVADTTTVDEAPIVRFVDLLIAKAVQERASDIHVEPSSEGLRVRFRVDGVLRDAMFPPKSLQAGIISRIKVMAGLDIAERRLPQDGRSSAVANGRVVDLRVATMPTVNGESAVLRILQRTSELTVLSDLGFLSDQQALFEAAYRQPWGAILVTGPTGSGKTTTLYATLRKINDPTRNILTVEDPVEIRLDGVKQVQVNVKAGLTFASALRSFLRADPDVILVGEIRDRETATIAVEASLTGHLVLSTLHTNDAASTPARLIEMGVEPYLVTSALRAVVAQRLCRRLCDRCRQAFSVTADQAVAMGLPVEVVVGQSSVQLWRPAGCDACSQSGYRGRLAIHEIMTVTPELAELVLGRAHRDEVAQTAIAQGMSSLRVDGSRKVLAGATTLEELLRVIV
jgi:type IV pilus assembly protein PilB